MNTVINISRCETVVSSVEEAIVYLDLHTHTKGEPVIVEYYKDGNLGTDILFAIGKQNGIGRDCYSIVSIGEETVVSGITWNDNIDVSAVYHEAKYLSCNPSYLGNSGGTWCLVTIDNHQIKNVEILSGERIFRNTADGFRWFYVIDSLKREDNFYTKIETESVIKDNIYKAVPISMTVETGNTVFENSYSSPRFDISVIDAFRNNVTSNSTITFTSNTKGNEIIDNINGDEYTLVGNSISVTTTYTITAQYKGATTSQSVTFYISPKVLYGPYKAFTGQGLYSPASEEIEFIFNLSDDISIVALPLTFPLVKHIYDEHGLDYIGDYDVTVSNGYRYYKKQDSITLSSFKQLFKFID